MSTKSKKTKQKSINQLINTLLETNLYHPQHVENTNRELNTRIYQHQEKTKMTQDELLRLKNNLRHTK